MELLLNTENKSVMMLKKKEKKKLYVVRSPPPAHIRATCTLTLPSQILGPLQGTLQPAHSHCAFHKVLHNNIRPYK